MTVMPMIQHQINHPAAWKGSDFKNGKSDVAFEFTAAHLKAFDEILAKIHREKLTLNDLELKHFDHPALNSDLKKIFAEIQDGRGIVIMRPFPVGKYTEEEIGFLYWGIGTHFGYGVSQSVLGDRLGHVQDHTKTDPNARAYRANRELTLHTDLSDIVSLCSLQKSKTGGFSRFASAITIHNDMLQNCPDLLEALYEGYPYHRHGEQKPGDAPITPHKVPLFSQKEGYLTVRYVRSYMTSAAKEMGSELPKKLNEALDYFDALAQRSDIMFECMLEPGEAVFVNNHVVMHARTGFQDGDLPSERRHLLRLWLDVENGRPVVPEIDVYGTAGSGRGGVAAQEGRTPSFDQETLKY